MSSPAPVAQQATTAQTAVAACTKQSFGGIVSCLVLVLTCAMFGYGSGKNPNGSTPATGKFLYFLAACYCCSTLSSIWNYMFPPKCDATASATVATK